MERFHVKPEVYFNTGALEYLTGLDKEKAFIISDPFMVKVGFTDQLAEVLKSSVSDYELFTNIKPDPPIEVVAEGVRRMLSYQPDVVIALGGGSTIDAAKGIITITEKLQAAAGNDAKKKPEFIAIPTTSGTGSEVTSFSIITVGGEKIPLIDDSLIPDVAIIDANFVKTVPPQITADTAIDVLTHAIEAYVSTAASDYSDALAEKAAKLVFTYLLRAYQDGSDIEAREKLHNASCIAGMAFTNASLGLNHGMAHALGGAFHIPHGRANAILLPFVIKYNTNFPDAGKKYAALAKELGLPAATVAEGINSLISAITVLTRETKVPVSLKEMGIEKEAYLAKLDAMSDAALHDRCTATNPRLPEKNEVKKLYLELYEK
ncbi:iron-containing alcohol dehydrogenase [Bacillaceae bacterium Marseille-Q3522]|nr:iron-containing alcohol dehydrogenase [Bacillaceae bacterium Marseille-Q3522]